jgi:molybdopterin-guanine dinucleotide biosynthesis protein MobB
LQALETADALNALALPGVRFLPAHFRPQFDKHSGATCAGAQLHVTDSAVFRPFETGLRVVETVRRLAPGHFRWRAEPYEFDPRPAIDLLTGSTLFRETLERGGDLAERLAQHDAGARDFLLRRGRFVLYPDRRPAVVAFVGGHNAGKTTLIEDLLRRLRALGLSVGAIKHSSKDAEDDVPGKDSQRLSATGVAASAFVTPARTTARRFLPDQSIEDLLRREFFDCDLVLIEGYKSLPVPKIEVARSGATRPPVSGVSGRVSDRPEKDGIPTCAFEDREGILAMILEIAGLDRPGALGAPVVRRKT